MNGPDPLNFINVGPSGTFTPSGDYTTTAAQIDQLIEHLEANDAARLALHFHGGLIAEEKGAAIAARMAPVFDSPEVHPVTFVWETGLGETLRNNISTITSTKLYGKLVEVTAKMVGDRIGGNLGGRGPGGTLEPEELEDGLREDDPLGRFDDSFRSNAARIDETLLDSEEELEALFEEELDADEELAVLVADEAERTELFDPDRGAEIDEELAPDGRSVVSMFVVARALARITLRVIGRLRNKRDHGVYPTIFEETVRELYLADAGRWVWSGMKQAAHSMWLPNTDLEGNDRHVGTYFLEGLAELQERRDLQVDLIGHSAGSVAICHLLAANDLMGMGVAFRNLIFLAPAVRTDLFYNEVVSHQDRFEEFRMFTMDDENEGRDRLMGRAYPRSLLYLISGILETEPDATILGMQRHVSGEEPYQDGELRAVAQFVNAPTRSVWSVTGGDAPRGFRTESRRHGDFDEDPATRDSLRAIVVGD